MKQELQLNELQEQLEALRRSHLTAQRRTRIQTLVLGLGLIFASTWAAATAFNFGSSNNVPSTFAYEGTLVIDGSKVTGSYDMKFTVVDASAAEHDFELTGVSVSDGKFAVEIGPLNQSHFDGGDGDDILLKIAVKQNGSYVPLGSGQKLTSVPFAAKASKAVGADDFYVSGKVGIGTTPQVQLHLMHRAAVGTEGSGSVSLELVTKDGDTNVLGPPAPDSRGWWLGARGNNYSNSTEINDLQFHYWDGSSWRNDFAIDSLSGNVGIGTVAPQQKLDVGGAVKANTYFNMGGHYTTGSHAVINIGPTSGVYFRQNDTAYDPSNFTNLMVIGGDGNVSIGGSVTAQGTTLTSDERYKQEIEDLTGALKSVSALRGVRFTWRTDAYPDRYFSDARELGFIAQEVERVFPELVATDRDGFKSVAYSKLTPLLVEAIKELQGELEARDRRLTSLEDKVEFLLKELEERQAR